MDLSVWIARQIYGFIREIGYTTVKDATGRTEKMNTICLGCGDEMFANVLICEVCWNGE